MYSLYRNRTQLATWLTHGHGGVKYERNKRWLGNWGGKGGMDKRHCKMKTAGVIPAA